MLGIPIRAPALNIQLSLLSHNSIASLCLTFRYGRSDQTAVLLVDEVSLVTSILLSMMNKQLEEMFDCSELFGGLSVILLGNFQQMNPVTRSTLPASVVEQQVYD